MNPHGGQDWLGFAVVLAMLLVPMCLWVRHLQVASGAQNVCRICRGEGAVDEQPDPYADVWVRVECWACRGSGSAPS